MLRNALRKIVLLVIKSLARLHVTGLENVPRRGGCLLAVNHLSRVDPALVFALIDHRDDVTALVTDKYQSNPLFRWLVEAVHGIWINREQADFQALREARDFLQKGGALGIAPEGTRSSTGGLIQAKTGVAYLAEKTGVPIVPVAITGTEKWLHELTRFRRPHLHVVFGEPFSLPSLDRRDRSLSLQRNTDEIMYRIAALLPPAYRGVYASPNQPSRVA
jgi:1-acyl-sn-glycerol-3-phosphate acyltransferase